MILSKSQQQLFWKLWNGACDCQGWSSAEAEARRREVLRDVGFESLTQVDKTVGFDRLKARLMTLQNRISGAMEEVYPDLGTMRRHMHLLEANLIPSIGREIADPEAYVDTIARDKFGHPGPWRTLADDPTLGPRKIHELLMTVTRCAHRLGVPWKNDKPLKKGPFRRPPGQTAGPVQEPAPQQA